MAVQHGTQTQTQTQTQTRTERQERVAARLTNAPHRLRRLAADWSVWALLVMVAAAVGLHLYQLGHTSIGSWDEAFHAVVALHLAQHPLQPTLYDIAALTPPTALNWDDTHIWLHIAPFGMWSSALSMWLLGFTPFALRLPGLIFALAGMVVTYILGRRVYTPAAGLAGAAFVGFAPYTLLLGQDYVFGDITDTPLLLLAPLTVLGMVEAYRSGRLRWLVVAGAAQGFCYLTKGGIGLAPLAIIVALYACERLFPPEAGWRRLGLRGLAVYMGTALLVAGPYTLYTALAFPASYAVESHNWEIAFFQNFENWGRPVDYHATMYLYTLYGPGLALLLAAAAVTLAIVAVRSRSRADVLVVVWIAALYVPLTVAVSKAVPMCIEAVPVFGLAAARLVSLGLASPKLAHRALTLGLLLGSAGASLWFLAGGTPLISRSILATYTSTSDTGSTTGTLPAAFPADVFILRARIQPYVLELGATLAAALLCAGVLWGVRRMPLWLRPAVRLDTAPLPPAREQAPTQRGLLSQGEPVFITLVLAVALLALSVTWLRYDWAVVGRATNDPGPMWRLGPLVAQHTPANATILWDGTQQLQPNANFVLGFWAHRDVYPAASFPGADVCSLARTAAQHGSPLYLLTPAPSAGAALGSAAGWTLYAPDCTPPR